MPPVHYVFQPVQIGLIHFLSHFYQRQEHPVDKSGAYQDRQQYHHDEYVDDGVSGTTFDRPQFNRLIADIEARKNKYGSNQRFI